MYNSVRNVKFWFYGFKFYLSWNTAGALGSPGGRVQIWKIVIGFNILATSHTLCMQMLRIIDFDRDSMWQGSDPLWSPFSMEPTQGLGSTNEKTKRTVSEDILRQEERSLYCRTAKSPPPV